MKNLFLEETAAPGIELVQQFGSYFARNTIPDYRVIMDQRSAQQDRMDGESIFSIIFVLLLILCTCCAAILDGKVDLPTWGMGTCVLVSCITGFTFQLWFMAEHFSGKTRNDIDGTFQVASMALELDIYEKNFEDVFAKFFTHRPDILSYQKVIQNPQILRVLTQILDARIGRDIIYLLLQFTLSPYEIQALNAWQRFIRENRMRIEAEEKKEEKSEFVAKTLVHERPSKIPDLRFRGTRDKSGEVTITAYPNNQKISMEKAITFDDAAPNEEVVENHPKKRK